MYECEFVLIYACVCVIGAYENLQSVAGTSKTHITWQGGLGDYKVAREGRPVTDYKN